MSEAGYTLTETLAAMAVIGLAAGGISLGMQVIGAQQGAVGATVLKAQEARAAEQWLERRFAEHGPFRSHQAQQFSGGADGFRFACGAAAPCDVRVVAGDDGPRLEVFRGIGATVAFRLPSDAPARFLYRGAGEAGATWPPADAARQALRSVSLLQGEAGHERVVFEVRVRTEQPADCQFDAVMQDCR